jgi:hypothetical protein
VEFQVLTAASIEMTDFWNVALCSLVEAIDVSEVRTACIVSEINDIPDKRGSSHLRNVDSFYETIRRSSHEIFHF